MGHYNTMYHTTHILHLLLLLPVTPLHVLHHVNLNQMAGAAQQVGQTVAAGLAVNTQWFQPSGTGVSACNSESVSATLYPGWPGYMGNTVIQSQVGTEVSVCIRRRVLLRGGGYGPWRYFTGTIRQGFRPGFGGFGWNNVGINVRDTDEYEVIDDTEDT